MRAFVEQLRRHPTLGKMLVHHQRLEGAAPLFAHPAEALPRTLHEALGAQGIERLYSHQARGVDLARAGKNVLLVTPTASGKTLLFVTSVLESLQRDRESRALLLYPTKALARDQLAGFRSLAGGLGALNPPRFEIYDGDTPAALRRKLKQSPPEALLTNPDMLHMGLLSHHQDWEPFLRQLRWIVIDELHVYRGIFGAHVHHILARLQRLCAKLGAHPKFIAASATVGNPAHFARTLVGQPFEVIEDSGAPQSSRDVLFFNPVGVSPYTVAVSLLIEALRAELRTIAFTKARRVTELLYTWLVRQAPELRHRIAPYRAGYLPRERRQLEARLFSGELTAILSTSALELGIDVGGLDVCLLVGYPGSLISSWQRIGRVGRKGRAGLVLLVAMPDALDQYIVRHPELFFGRSFEHAVLDPWNPLIAGRHLVCAAAEAPLSSTELGRDGEPGAGLADSLVEQGSLVQDAKGERYFSFRRRPHRDVSPRSAGEPFSIVDRDSGSMMGSIDATRVYHECHPGAIYLHGGRSYLIDELDTERRRALARPADVDYYTVVLGDKETEILERLESRSLGPFPVGLGRLKVTVHIREYQKKRLFDGEPVSTHPLQVPPLVFETIGFWVELPPGLPAAYAQQGLHFMGGIHATEHATIGLFPLLAIADRGDVGGISYTGHPQIGGPAIFVYDGVPGGAGLASRGYRELELLLGRTLELVRGCGCEEGCPGCIQSPRCGNGNKPLDKQAALLTLQLLCGETELAQLEVEALPSTVGDRPPPLPPAVIDPAERRGHGISRAGNLEPEEAARLRDRVESGRTLVFDLETQLSADEVGGWKNIPRMRLALAVVFDVAHEAFRTYYEADVDRLLLDLVMADRVIGFNLDRFDLPVLSAYTEWDLTRVRTFDLLADIHRRLGFRISLAHLCEVNLGQSKAGDGLQSLRWWKEGRIDLIEQYCRQDVELTRRLYERGRRDGFLLYRDHSERVVRLPVDW
jgi:DEAD/DEAH box helicase domain-containing protein